MRCAAWVTRKYSASGPCENARELRAQKMRLRDVVLCAVHRSMVHKGQAVTIVADVRKAARA